MKPYRIDYADSVLKRDIRKLSKPVLIRIKKAIEDKLTTKPLLFGKPLQENWKGHYSLRVGDYRVIYRVNGDQHNVKILAIQHRSYVYE